MIIIVFPIHLIIVDNLSVVQLFNALEGGGFFFGNIY